MRFSVSRSEILLRRTQKLKYLVLCFLLVASCYLLVAAFPTFAQTGSSAPPATANSYTQPQMNPDVPKNLHTWTQNVMIETMAALTCQLAGIDPVNPNQKCLGVDQKTGNIGFVENGGGAIGLMGNAITMLYTPPLHTGDYFQDLASNFGIAKQAKAQTTGTGFDSLSPLITIWSAFRNIVYLLFVLVFVIIGLAIMLRVKIDPRTVMTIQNQIPKIIVGLLLVTFSFSIAGFLIDMMYTSIYLAGNAIAQTDPKIANTDIVTNLSKSTNPFGAANHVSAGIGFADIAWKPAQSVGGYIEPIFENAPGRIITGIIGAAIGNRLGSIVQGSSITQKAISWINRILTTGGAAATAAPTPQTKVFGIIAISVGGLVGALGVGGIGALFGGTIVGFIVSILAFLVISIAILFALFRLWFALLSAYVFILLDVVTAPFWIFAGLIPGSPLGFGLWLRDIVSNLAVFPVTIIMFLLGRVFVDTFGSTQAAGQFVPPLIGNPSSTNAIGYLIGLGFILLTPNVVNITKAALKAPKFDTTPIKQALGAGVGTYAGTARNIWSTTAGREFVPDPNNPGQWKQKGRVLSAFGKLLR